MFLFLRKKTSQLQNSVSFATGSGKTGQKTGFSTKSKVAFSKAEVLKKPKTVFAGLALLLVAGLLLVGCDTDTNDDFVDDHQLNSALIGTWRDYYDESGYDGYTITATDLSYGYGGDGYELIGYAGTIKYVSNFTADAGVIIIEYDADKKPSYSVYDANWELIETLPPKGDFVGIYYQTLKPGVSVQMSQAIDLSDNTGAEKTTLDAAIAAFTMGNSGNYVGQWGGPYSQQQ